MPTATVVRLRQAIDSLHLQRDAMSWELYEHSRLVLDRAYAGALKRQWAMFDRGSADDDTWCPECRRFTKAGSVCWEH